MELTWPCKGKCGRRLSEVDYMITRKYCPYCKDKRQLAQQNAKNRRRKTILTYGRMFSSLTKNYIYFVEGLKK